MRTTMWFLLVASSLSACKWTEFDDLQDQTWVTSTQKPNVKSSDWGVAIQRGGDGRLVVIGAGQAVYSELLFDAKGTSSLAPAAVALNAQYGISNLDPQPILLASPGNTDDVALIVNGGSSIAVLAGTQGTLDLHQVAAQPSTVDAATYLQAPPRTDVGHIGEVPPLQPLVASGDVVLGTFYANAPKPQPACKLTDAGTPIGARALGAVRIGASTFDDVLAWGANGKLYVYPGSVFHGCMTQEPKTSVDTGFLPGHGAQILALDATHVVLQGHHDGDDASLLQVYDVGVTPPVAVGEPVGAGGPVVFSKVRTAAILTSNGTQYVVAGLPTSTVNTKVAGVVEIFTITPAGIDARSAVSLTDAQPESNQSFGRAVAVMPFHGKQVIAVAADNEIFVYFRAQLADGTSLYDETRQGR
jgi:hypothetical protein